MFKVSVFRFQDFAIHLPDTRNLTPGTYVLQKKALLLPREGLAVSVRSVDSFNLINPSTNQLN